VISVVIHASNPPRGGKFRGSHVLLSLSVCYYKPGQIRQVRLIDKFLKRSFYKLLAKITKFNTAVPDAIAVS